MQVKTIGLDLAKDVFQVHGVSVTGDKVFNKKIKRAKLLEFFEGLPPCVVGMEACGSAHHWGRELRNLGHDVRLMPATTSSHMSNAERPTQWMQRQSAKRLAARR
jgi:transposase